MASAEGSAALHAAVSGDYFDTNNANDTAELVVAVSSASSPRLQPPARQRRRRQCGGGGRRLDRPACCSSLWPLCIAPAVGALESPLDCRHLGSHACGSRRREAVATYKDYYQIMGVARDASQDEIKRAYRRLARKFHPDVSKEANAEEKFKEVQEAYEVLKDPQRRAAYDQLGSNWRAGQEFRPPPDWGRDFEFSTSSFGGGGGGRTRLQRFLRLAVRPAQSVRATLQPGRRRRRGARLRRRRGEDHVAKIQIDLEDAFQRRRAHDRAQVAAARRRRTRRRATAHAQGDDSGRRHRRSAHSSRRPGQSRRRRRAGRRSVSGNRLSPAPAVHGRRPRPDADVADRAVGSGARCDSADADTRRTGGSAHSAEREGGTEDAPERPRPARPDSRAISTWC